MRGVSLNARGVGSREHEGLRAGTVGFEKAAFLTGLPRLRWAWPELYFSYIFIFHSFFFSHQFLALEKVEKHIQRLYC